MFTFEFWFNSIFTYSMGITCDARGMWACDAWDAMMLFKSIIILVGVVGWITVFYMSIIWPIGLDRFMAAGDLFMKHFEEEV